MKYKIRRKRLFSKVAALLLTAVMLLGVMTNVHAAEPYSKIAFDGGGGQGTMWTVIPREDGTYTVPECEFVRAGYEFTGWLGTDGKSYKPGDTVRLSRSSTEPLGLTAQWRAKPETATISMVDGVVDLYLRANETIRLSDIPAGTAYQVWEEIPDGWMLVAQVNESGTIVANDTVAAEFTNKYMPGATSAQFSGTKYMDGAPASAGSFRFSLYEGDTLITTVTNGEGGFIQFPVLAYNEEGTHNYTIREENPNNPTMRYDSHVEHVKVNVTWAPVRQQQRTLTTEVIYDSDGIMFRNSTLPGDLSIQKNASGLTDTNKDDVFTVIASFLTPNGTPVNAGGFYYYYEESGRPINQGTTALPTDGLAIQSWPYASVPSEMLRTESNGNIVVLTLKAGQKIVFPNIPAGYRYEVSETSMPDGWEMTGMTGSSGDITAGETAKAVITNAYSAVGYAQIMAYKNLIGNDPEEGQFTFELLSDGAVLDVKNNEGVDTREEIAGDGDVNIANPYYRMAPVYFDRLTYTKAGDYTYTIREIQGNDSKIVYSQESVTVNVHVEDAGDGILATTVTYSPERPVFTNTIKPGALTVSKTIMNATEEAEDTAFTFTVMLYDASGNELTEEYPVTLTHKDKTTDSLTVSSGGTITLIGGESCYIDNLPDGATYEITESEEPGWELTTSDGISGTIEANKTAAASLTNLYTSVGTVEIEANKTIYGGDITKDVFSFELRNEEGAVIATAINDKDGKIKINVPFTHEDDGKTFTYYLSEVIGEDDVITYDTHIETITVEVHDNGMGEMIGTVSYDDDGAEFVNYITHELAVKKTISGNMGDKSRAFNFRLSLSGENLDKCIISLSTGREAEEIALTNGTYEFSLTHGETATFSGILTGISYTITELDGNTDGYVTTVDGEETTAKQGVLTEDTEVEFVNTNDTSIPTRAEHYYSPLWLVVPVLVLGAFAAFTIIRKRKEA